MKTRIDIHCPICRGKRYKKYFAQSGYSLAKCEDCGMVWDYEPPSYILEQYDEGYFENDNPKGGYANYFKGMRINNKTFKNRLLQIESKLGRKGKLLDVGCALGDCLTVAKELGWEDAEGIEISTFASDFAERRGLKIHKKPLINSDYKANYFDVVMYQDVIEHLLNPLDELKRVYRILKPGGIIFIVTPDVAGWWSKLLGPLWYHYKPKEHVMYFSQKTVRMALEKSGYINIETRKTYHILSLEYILNRLRYYIPTVLGILLSFVKKFNLGKIPFKSYTGELEAWATKPY